MRLTILISLLAAGACSSAPSNAGAVATSVPSLPGATTPRAAVESFMGAIASRDLHQMSTVWGNKDGPIAESKLISREEIEQRELYLMRCLKHDRYRFLGESPGADSERVFSMELIRGTEARVTDFNTARGSGRWYVRSVNMEPVRELCAVK